MKKKEEKRLEAHKVLERFEQQLSEGEQKLVETRWEVGEKGTGKGSAKILCIDEQKKRVKKLESSIEAEEDELNEIRLDIEPLKGPGAIEDTNFNIDNTRDQRGHTFLQVAAQNNDFDTAQLCLRTGADPSVTNSDGLAAIDYSHFFGFEIVTNLLLQNGGSLPKKQVNAWSFLQSIPRMSAEASKDWNETIKVAEVAALPAESLMEDPAACEDDEDKRMEILTDEERLQDFTCFEARLLNPNINSDQFHRTILLDQSGTLHYFCLLCWGLLYIISQHITS